MSHLPYAGIASFARAPLVEPAGDWQADAAVLGVPFDLAVGFRPGARFAPRAVREASLRYALPPEGFFDLRSERWRLAGLRLRDAGDVLLPSLEADLSRERIEQAAILLRQRAKLPIFLGGDHSVSYPLLRAYRDVPGLHVVQFDAHLDFTDQRNDTRYSNSSPFRRAVEALPNLEHLSVIGLRGLRTDAEAWTAARSRGHTLIPAWTVTESAEAVADMLPHGRPVYLSLDVDVLDPSVLPATSSPEVAGLSYQQLLSVIASVVERNHLVGLDLVELTPMLDASGNSALLAARLLMDVLALVFP